MQKRFAIPTAALFLLAGFGALGWLLYFTGASNILCPRYEFINAEVGCGETGVLDKTNYEPTRNEIIRYIESQKAGGRVESVSFYFRDLENGPSTGYEEYALFSPASLLKFPLAFVFMTAADEDPAFLDTQIRYTGETEVSLQGIPPTESAQPDIDYRVRELLRLMLAYSDNASYAALDAYLANQPSRIELRQRVFQELGLIDPASRSEGTVSVRGYASLFRVLYEAAYLSPEHSEQMLAWLADSDYRRGLVAGVHPGTRVAHKFGERLLPDGTKQLHDCGIVYYPPENPYLLCVMTRGDDWTALEEAIAAVSRMIYTEVDSRRIMHL